MRKSIRVGFGYGLTSGIITTLGLMTGIATSTNSNVAVLGAIITIAVVDSLSDAFGIHISTEFSGEENQKNIWESTFFTFLSKFLFAIIFIIPIILFSNLFVAIIVSAIIGIFILGFFSYKIAKTNNVAPYKIIFEHVFVAIGVIFLTYFLGIGINKVF